MTTENTKPEWAQSRREKANAERVAKGLKPRRRIWPWILLVLVIAAVVAMFVLRPEPTAEAELAELAPVVKQIKNSEVTTIAPQLLQQTVKVTGTFAPGEQSDVASQVSGRVLSVAVRPGDSVAKGQVLATIDTENLEIQLSQQRATADATRAQLLSAEQQLARSEELAKSGLASPSALEQARSSAAALRANLAALENGVKSAELSLSNANVRAPIDGVVSARSVEPGQSVAAGTPLLTVVNLDVMEYQASASVSSSALIAPGQQVRVTVAGLDSREFLGTVTRVNPVALAGTRTVPVYILLDNADHQLRGGMFATGQIVVVEKSGATAIPSIAVREDAEGFHVLKIVDEKLVRQPVETGTSWDRGRIVETEGLSHGDVVVTAPLTQLEADDAVQMIEG